MSSLTKDQWIDELQESSSILAGLDDSTINTFVDRAMRIYSSRLPKVLWDVDVDVVSGQELYDFPVDAVRIISIRTSSGRDSIDYQIEDQSGGEKIRIGSVQRHSYEDLLSNDYYVDPLNSGSNRAVVFTTETIISGDTAVGYSSFDIEFAALQTVPDVSDGGLEVLAFYVEYLGYNSLVDEASEALVSLATSVASSITDAASDGSSTTISYTTQEKKITTLEKIASAKLDRFEEKIREVHFGRRG